MKPQPTNCEAHWVFALGFSVLYDINNNYVILTWLPSVHASRSLVLVNGAAEMLCL